MRAIKPLAITLILCSDCTLSTDKCEAQGGGATAEAAERPGEAGERAPEAGLLAEGGGGPEKQPPERGCGAGPGEELGRGGAGVQQSAHASGQGRRRIEPCKSSRIYPCPRTSRALSKDRTRSGRRNRKHRNRPGQP